MIFYNAERFLREAIESVFAQTYPAWELLLVDDGSTDGGTRLARSLAEQHPGRVRYLEHAGHQNCGTGASRNLGVTQARGTYIAFLDADDVWLPNKLAEQVDILEGRPDVGLLYGLSQWWYSWTGRAEDQGRDFTHPLGMPAGVVLSPPALLAPFFLNQEAAVPNPSSLIVRREVVEQVGGFDAEFRSNYEDQAFLAKVCLVAPAWASNQVWDRYRQHPDSTSAVSPEKAVAERLYFLDWLERYLTAQGFANPPAMRALRRQRWLYRHAAARRLAQLARRVKLLPFQAAYRFVPSPIFDWLRAIWRGEAYRPPAGWVRLGSLRRLTPLSKDFGYDRGQPIDRYYIEAFLAEHQADIQGHSLEIGENTYTRRFGEQRVTRSDVLHVSAGHPQASLAGDLTDLKHVAADTFDCIILTQTLQFIYDLRAALHTAFRILRPGGVLLVTVPGITPISRYDAERWGDFWRFTSQSARRLFEEVFPAGNVQVYSYGNVLSAAAFLYGMATEELKPKEMVASDPNYEVIVAIRAVKPEQPDLQRHG